MATRGPRNLSPGQQLVIPRQTAVSAAPALAAPVSKPVAVAAAPAVHIVNPGDHRCSVSRAAITSRCRSSQEPTVSKSTAKLRLGMKLTVPGAKTGSSLAPAAQPATVCGCRSSRSLQWRRPPQDGCRGRAPAKRAARPGHRDRSKTLPSPRRSRRPRPPARCRRSAWPVPAR